MGALLAHTSVHDVHVVHPGPPGARVIDGSIIQVLGIKPGSSEKPVSALNHRDISFQFAGHSV